jgi:hypothetical protein
VRKRLAIGAACGFGWGAVAAAVFLAMFRGDLGAPGDVGLPVAIGLVLLQLPFVVAAGLETAAGRPSPAFAEIIGVTLASGAGLGLLVSSGIALAQRVARGRRSPA